MSLFRFVRRIVALSSGVSLCVGSATGRRWMALARPVATASLGLACLAATPRRIWSQGILSGTVRAGIAAAPIAGANLVLDGTTSTQSQSDGHYRFEHVARGTHLVTVRAVGYKERVDTVSVDSTAVQTLHDFALERIAVLDSVITTARERKYVSPGLQGFEERRAAGFGHFITDSILRREENEPLVNILKTHVTGLRTIRVYGDDYAVATHAEGAGAGAVRSGRWQFGDGLALNRRLERSKRSTDAHIPTSAM